MWLIAQLRKVRPQFDHGMLLMLILLQTNVTPLERTQMVVPLVALPMLMLLLVTRLLLAMLPTMRRQRALVPTLAMLLTRTLGTTLAV